MSSLCAKLQASVLEYHLCLANGRLTPVSVQEYVDCTDGKYKNAQCDGGWYDYAWQYTQDLKTVSSENDYGYINGVVSVSLCNLTAVALHYYT